MLWKPFYVRIYFVILFISLFFAASHCRPPENKKNPAQTWPLDEPGKGARKGVGDRRHEQTTKEKNSHHDTEQSFVVQASENHSATIIWLHSLGDSGHHFASDRGVDLPGAISMPWCRFIFPTAGKRNVSLHGGDPQPAWFDIERIDARGVVEDKIGINKATERIVGLISAEIKSGIPPHRIVVAGFGQGGVVAINAALTIKHRLGGVLALSSWFSEASSVAVAPDKVGLPLLFCHGEADTFIPARLAQEASARLSDLGVASVVKTYQMLGHAFSSQLVPWNISQEDIPSLMDTEVKEHAPARGAMRLLPFGSKFMTRRLVLHDGILEAHSQTKNDLLASYDLTLHQFQIFPSHPKKSKSARFHCGLVIRRRKKPIFCEHQPSADSRFTEDACSADSVPQYASGKPGHSAKMAKPSARGWLWGWLWGWRRSKEAGVDGQEVARYWFRDQDERDAWLHSIGRWQQVLIHQQHSSELPRPLDMGAVPTQPRPARWSLLRTVAVRPLQGVVRAIRAGGSVFKKVLGHGRASRKKVPEWEYVVFSGGGIKGLVHPAALGIIADSYGASGRSLSWVRGAAGVSAGSVVAALVACGCTVDEVQTAAAALEVPLASGWNTLQAVRNLHQVYGVYDGMPIAELVDGLIFRQTGIRGATFQQLYELSGKVLKVYATSCAGGTLREFSVFKTPRDQVAMACRASMAVPFLLSAVPTTDGDLLVDGGVLDNCPLHAFDGPTSDGDGARSSSSSYGGHDEKNINPRTLGFWISSVEEPQQVVPGNIKEYSARMIELVMYAEQYRHLRRQEQSTRVVWIPVPDIPLSTFTLDADTQRTLQRCGEEAAARFLSETSPSLKAGTYRGLPRAGDGPRWARRVSAAVMDWFADGKESPSDRVRRFVSGWLTERPRATRLLRDSLPSTPPQPISTGAGSASSSANAKGKPEPATSGGGTRSSGATGTVETSMEAAGNTTTAATGTTADDMSVISASAVIAAATASAGRSSTGAQRGNIRLLVKEATNLPHKERKGSCDAFAAVSFGGDAAGKATFSGAISSGRQRLQTEVVWNSDKPRWNKEFEIAIGDEREVLVEVFDVDSATSDDLIGVARVPISVATAGSAVAELILQLAGPDGVERRGAGGAASTVTVAIVFPPAA